MSLHELEKARRNNKQINFLAFYCIRYAEDVVGKSVTVYRV